jgi:potassium-transporting ATPase KdpC subunit
MKAFTRQLVPSVVMLLAFTVICGLIYPAAVWAVGQVAFNDRANGSLIEDADGNVVGSKLLGQPFSAPEYFHPRPSSAGSGYDGAASSGSNLGPTNPDFLATVEERVAAYREENGLPGSATVPVDAVTGSGSGLDPHISVANARIQAARVADERSLDLDVVLGLVDDNTDDRIWGVLGDPGANVLELNIALDDLTAG